ncbi:hypothetical protein BamMEX5DRAFT_0962 [Burkholderia ambifaria MEX-5]|uniref:Uncharacterized protein n=1 Tax=Burkholderia ambifaria MEX-5 TaxID=396597 RepID=B1SZJ6_9BURK|nr:hypothetical protein BamMEX5DRAFT_0962 [Burkholderia ambifaria MEX-5]
MLTRGAAAVIASRRCWLAWKIDKGLHTPRTVTIDRVSGPERMKCFSDVT